MSLRLRLPGQAPKELSADVTVVGGGPAGVAAGVYLARYGLTCVLVAAVPGGRTALASVIENYPGFPSVSGSELVSRMMEQLSKHGVRVLVDEVVDVERIEGLFVCRTKAGHLVRSLALVLATGAKERELGVPGEREFLGKGVSYCSTCDAPLFKGAKNVVVVGGGDTALDGAYVLSFYAKSVTVVHRRKELRAQRYLVERALSRGNVRILVPRVVVEILGDTRVRGVRLANPETGETELLEADGVFVHVGYEPNSFLAARLGAKLDERGHVAVNTRMETSVEGLFAAGDVTNMWEGFDQIVTAAAQGAIAARSAYEYVSSKKASQALKRLPGNAY